MKRMTIHALCTGLLILFSPHARADKVPSLVPAKSSAYPKDIDGFFTIPYRGTLRGLMIFVDFRNLPGKATGQIQPRDIARNLLGIRKDGTLAAADFLKQQSCGKLKFEVDIDYAWARIDKEKTGTYPGGGRPKEYIQDALRVAMRRNHDLSRYHILYVVAPRGLHPLSPHHCVPPDDLKEVPNLPRSCVTFGDDGQRSRIEHLVHETAHGMGLPDLYNYEPVPPERVQPGPWALMSDNWRAIGFCAWNRHLWGWLDDSRKVVVGKGQRDVRLAPLDGPAGTGMIVIPTARFPGEVLVIENPRPWNPKVKPGVLIYKVDYTVKRGRVPITLILSPGAKDARSVDALWQPGQTYEGENLSVKIVREASGSYLLHIVKRQ